MKDCQFLAIRGLLQDTVLTSRFIRYQSKLEDDYGRQNGKGEEVVVAHLKVFI